MGGPNAPSGKAGSAAPHVRRRPTGKLLKPLHQGHIREANAWSVLAAVRAAGVISTAQATRETGLTAMTVHRLITDLRGRKLVVSAGRSTEGSVGRPPSLFRFNASLGTVAGIDVGNETTRIVLADLDGRSLAHVERSTAEIEADLAQTLSSAVNELQLLARVQRGSLVSVGVGVPAVVDGMGTIVRASQHHAWEGLPLGASLRDTLGAEVIVRQDDHLAALAELHHGSCVGARTAVVLDVGKGIGVGIVTDGTIHSGAHAAAGRIAWLPLPIESRDPHEAEPLGSRLTGDGLVASYREEGGHGTATGAADVFTLDQGGDPIAAAVIDAFAARLGWVVAALVAVIDPEIVVVGGGVSRSFERLRPGVERRLAEIVPVPPRVAASSLVPDAVVLGAIEAACEVANRWVRERIRA